MLRKLRIIQAHVDSATHVPLHRQRGIVRDTETEYFTHHGLRTGITPGCSTLVGILRRISQARTELGELKGSRRAAQARTRGCVIAACAAWRCGTRPYPHPA